MRHLAKYYVGLLLTGSTFLVSCFNGEEDTCGKSDVNMTFTARAADGTADPGEGMRELRVVMAAPDGKILYNEHSPITPEGTTKTMTFHDVPNGTYDFYIVANEKGIPNIDFTNLEALKDIKLTAAPDSYIQESGIPIAAIASEEVSSSGSHEVSISRAVAKLCVTFKNETTAEQTLTGVFISNMKTDEGSLFPAADLPEGTDRLQLGDNSEIIIPGKGELTVVRYTYPNKSGSGYILNATWGNQALSEPLKLSAEEPLLDVGRNTQINLTVSLTGKPDKCLQVNMNISQWTPVEITPPTFE